MKKIITSFAQQDPQFSQYQFNQMVINPAYAGSRDALSAVVNVRQQWSGFDGAPRTQAFSLHGPLKKKRIGLGLSGTANDTKIEVLNSLGQVVLEERMESNSVTINLSNLANGLYVVKVVDGKEVIVMKKVMKE